MLLSLPGISSKNVNFLLDGFNNMNEVVKASRDKLRSVLHDKSEADTLYDFLNKEIKTSNSFKPNTTTKRSFWNSSNFGDGLLYLSLTNI